MSFLSQEVVACRVGFLSLRQRPGSSLVIIVGMACVIGVFLAMLSLASGLGRAIVAGGDSAHAIVYPADATSDTGTGLSPSSIGTILDAPGIAIGPGGKPLGSAEVLTDLPPAEGFQEGTLYLRGIGAEGAAVRPGFAIVSGRMFRTGAQELIVGKGAESEFGFKVGGRVILPNGEWPIVGEFAAGGGAVESQLLGDADTVMSAQRISGLGGVLVSLTSPVVFDQFKRWLTTNPALSVTVERESDYLRRTAAAFTGFFATLAYFVGCLMAIAALFGSVQIMYSTVEARTIEIATLRAIGYGPWLIALSVLLETVFLALVGALLGSAIAWLFFNGMQQFNGYTVFKMHVSGTMALFGLGAAAFLAILGSLPPAIRAARLSVAEALRAT